MSNLKELGKVLAYERASEEERDFSSLIKDFEEYQEGERVYCNHCLPCPVEIDIGGTIPENRTESRAGVPAPPGIVCPVCRSPRAKKIYDGIDSVVSRFQNGGPCRLSLHRCRNCGMMFLGQVIYPPEAVHEAYWRMLLASRLRSFSVDKGT